jgi:hypothetical protein
MVGSESMYLAVLVHNLCVRLVLCEPHNKVIIVLSNGIATADKANNLFT